MRNGLQVYYISQLLRNEKLTLSFLEEQALDPFDDRYADIPLVYDTQGTVLFRARNSPTFQTLMGRKALKAQRDAEKAVRQEKAKEERKRNDTIKKVRALDRESKADGKKKAVDHTSRTSKEVAEGGGSKPEGSKAKKIEDTWMDVSDGEDVVNSGASGAAGAGASGAAVTRDEVKKERAEIKEKTDKTKAKFEKTSEKIKKAEERLAQAEKDGDEERVAKQTAKLDEYSKQIDKYQAAFNTYRDELDRVIQWEEYFKRSGT